MTICLQGWNVPSVVPDLRRGGVDVVLAGLAGSGPVVCSRQVSSITIELKLSFCKHQVSLNPDMGLAEALGKTWDLVVLPGGGPGAAALAASPEVAPHPPFSCQHLLQ